MVGDEEVLYAANNMIAKFRKFEMVVKDRMKREELSLLQAKKDESETEIQKFIRMQFQKDFMMKSKPDRLHVRCQIPGRLDVQSGLYLLNFKFGWIMTCRTNKYGCDALNNSMLILTHGNTISNSSVFSSGDSVVQVKPDLEDFWKLKTPGISKPVSSCDSEDQRGLEKFNEIL